MSNILTKNNRVKCLLTVYIEKNHELIILINNITFTKGRNSRLGCDIL